MLHCQDVEATDLSSIIAYALIIKIGLESAIIEIWPRKYNPLYLVVMKVARVLNFHLRVIYAFYFLIEALLAFCLLSYLLNYCCYIMLQRSVVEADCLDNLIIFSTGI